MAWTHLQGTGTNTSSVASLAATYGTALSSGTKLIAYVSIGSTAAVSTSGVSDGTNAFTKVATFTFTTFGTIPNESSIWVLDTPAGDVGTKPTITASFTGATGSSGSGIVIEEVSGLQTGTSCLDGTPGTSTTTGTITSDSFPTYSSTAANEYLVQFYADSGNGQSVTTPTGYAGQDNNGINGNLQIVIAWKNSTGGSETGSWTGLPGSNAGYGLMAVAFELPGSAPAGPTVPQAELAPLILHQFGLDAAFQTSAPPTPSVNATVTPGVANVAVAALNPSLAIQSSPPSPGAIPAEFILAQFGLIYPQPTQTVVTNATVTPGVANVAVTALQPIAQVSAALGVGSVTVAALGPTPAVTAAPGDSNVTVAALGPTPAVTASPSDANVTVAGLTPTPQVTAGPGVSNVTVAGQQPSVEGDASPTAGVANVSVTADAPTPVVTGLPGAANVTVAGLTPTPQVTVFPGVAAVTVAAYNPSVSAGGNVTVTPGVASVTVAAYGPTPSVATTPGVASSTVAAFQALTAVGVPAGVAAVIAVALPPTIGLSVTVTPGVARVTAAAFTPSFSPRTTPSVAVGAPRSQWNASDPVGAWVGAAPRSQWTAGGPQS